MKIESIYIRGFGRIVDKFFEFPNDSAALIIEDNESGKSTLAAAILAGLCGFPRRKAAGEKFKLKDIYSPWNSENYAVEVVLSAAGKKYKVDRNFAKDSFIVRDLDTNKDISAEFDSDLAYHFLGLPRDDFQRVAFIIGKDVNKFGSSANIQNQLASAVSGSYDTSGADIALENLNGVKYLDEGRLVKIETAIERISKRIAEKQASMDNLDAQLDRAGDDAVNLDSEKEQAKELVKKLESLDIEYKNARLCEVCRQIKDAQNSQNDVFQLKTELKSLEQFSNFPANRSTQLKSALARIRERQEQLNELEKKKDELQNQISSIEKILDSAQQFTTAASDDLLQFETAKNSIKECMRACANKREEIEKEKRMLKAEGVDIDSSSEQLCKLETLSGSERDFIRSYKENQLQLESDAHCTQDLLKEISESLQNISNARKSLRLRGITVLSVFGLAGVVSVCMLILHSLGVVPSLIITALSMAFAAAGAVSVSKAGSIRADEKAELASKFKTTEEETGEIAEKIRSNYSLIKQISDKAGFSDSPSMLDAYRKSEASAGRCELLNSLNAQMIQVEESLKSVCGRANRLLIRFGESHSENISESLDHMSALLAKYLDEKKCYERANADMSDILRRIASKSDSMKDELSFANSVFMDAGIDTSQPLEDAVKIFDENEQKYNRYINIKDNLLPSAEKHIISYEDVVKLNEEEKSLENQLGSLISKGCNRAASEIDCDRVAVRNDLEAANYNIIELEKKVGSCVDAYRCEYGVLQEDVSHLKQQLKRAARFGEAVQMSADVIREVSQDTYRRWAVALNYRASEILSRLNPDYDDLRFDESLKFTVHNVPSDRIIENNEVDSYLSTGAKDQIYLAVKLACCEELSERESIPIILDDPLIAADDNRFKSGFEYVTCELSQKHQIIILSCHRSRHEVIGAMMQVMMSNLS